MSATETPSIVPPCQCAAPGFCPYLDRPMKGRLYELCSGTGGVSAEKSRQYRAKFFLEFQSAPTAGGCCAKKKIRKPSLAKRAVSFATTLAKWAADGFQFASAQEQRERRELCDACPLNQAGWCVGCGCHLNEKIKLRVSYCPVGKWFVERPRRAVEGPRHLLMHILPVADTAVWQWNVQQLLRRIDLFDGKRVIAVLTPDRGCKYALDSVETVQTAFAGHRIDEWIVCRNNPKLREVVTWPRLLAALSDTPGVTFACHAKGVTHGLHGGSITHRWTEAQWQTCLDDWPSVERALSHFSMAGAFKRYGQFQTPGNHRWHYSGTFYWFRNDDVFRSGRDWRKIDQQFFGNESWPGRMFAPEETACLFADDVGDLYQTHTWDSRINAEWEQWKHART